MSNRFRWGHININVANLDVAMEFYKKLDFEVFMAGIPYLNLSSDLEAAMPAPTAHALGWPSKPTDEPASCNYTMVYPNSI